MWVAYYFLSFLRYYNGIIKIDGAKVRSCLLYTSGMENLRVTDRTVMNYIKELMKSGLITKAKKGFYEKVKFETAVSYTHLSNRHQCVFEGY